MAKYRETVCMYYLSIGQCKKGREASHGHYCQKCDKYRPRAKVRPLNRKREKLQELNRKESRRAMQNREKDETGAQLCKS